MEEISIVRYNDEHFDEWNNFVDSSRNATFLINRNYLDYHKARFCDASVMINISGKLKALVPANFNKSSGTIWSHQGLTYGGIVTHNDMTGAEMLDIFKTLCTYFKEQYNAAQWIYKPYPHIYASYPSEEDLYALFKVGAQLTVRQISSTIRQDEPLPFRSLRKRGAKKALNNGYTIKDDNLEGLKEYWSVLDEVLFSRHDKHPVHTYDEILPLASRFRKNIILHTVANPDGKICAGVLVFLSKMVAHAQYIAGNEEAKQNGALDLLFHHLIKEVYKDIPFFDFGISSQDADAFLNTGLLFQKEGFGARAVCYDTYKINL